MSAVLSPIVSISTADAAVAAVKAYIDAKRDEDAAKARRIAAEDRILALLPPKEEGSQTVCVGGYKVTLTGKLTYKCDDPRGLAAACVGAGWADSMVPVKTEIRLDETGAKWLRHNEPEAWHLVAQYVEVKPAKTAVKVGV
ncbi:MAG: hypothetical protein RLZZ524_3004 [Pseudomonadota bacterium]|jgi:hypothetical protein